MQPLKVLNSPFAVIINNSSFTYACIHLTRGSPRAIGWRAHTQKQGNFPLNNHPTLIGGGFMALKDATSQPAGLFTVYFAQFGWKQVA